MVTVFLQKIPTFLTLTSSSQICIQFECLYTKIRSKMQLKMRSRPAAHALKSPKIPRQPYLRNSIKPNLKAYQSSLALKNDSGLLNCKVYKKQGRDQWLLRALRGSKSAAACASSISQRLTLPGFLCHERRQLYPRYSRAEASQVPSRTGSSVAEKLATREEVCEQKSTWKLPTVFKKPVRPKTVFQIFQSSNFPTLHTKIVVNLVSI